MNTFIVSALETSGGAVSRVVVQQFVPADGGGAELINPEHLDAGQLEHLVATEQVFVARWTADGMVPGSQVRTSGTRFVSVDKDGVENGDLMKLPQFQA